MAVPGAQTRIERCGLAPLLAADQLQIIAENRMLTGRATVGRGKQPGGEALGLALHSEHPTIRIAHDQGVKGRIGLELGQHVALHRDRINRIDRPVKSQLPSQFNRRFGRHQKPADLFGNQIGKPTETVLRIDDETLGSAVTHAV